MTLSVIIPVYNEAAGLGRTLAALQALPGDLEILVIDGGSLDDTVEIASRMGVTVASAPKGRAAQMNHGASLARGDVFLFLHADTELPADACELIAAAVARPEVAGGCFRLSFDQDRRLLRFLAFMTRSSFRLFHYGDQAFFVRREVYARLDGFRLYPIMEDLDFWLRLRRMGEVALLRRPVVTSARRFLENGVLRQQLLNVTLVLLYLAGVSPHTLARFYRNRRRAMASPYLSSGEGPVLSFGPRSPRDWIGEPLRTLWHWVHSNTHNAYVTTRVLDFMFRVRTAGRIPAGHPWATGIPPGEGSPIWPRNIVFASPRQSSWRGREPEADDVIIHRTAAFMAALVQRSTGPEIPQGPKRRMPHAVNYLHGPVHYNGGYLIFNDFRDALFHLSDRRFIREIRRFARTERRELTVVLRERSYDPQEYAWFVAFLRSRLPWYANPNGPTSKRVLWGTPSPYPAVNPINGSWIPEMAKLARGEEPPVRPAIEPGRWFQGSYRGNQPCYPFLVRFHAWASYLVIALRGFQGGMLFTSRRRIEPGSWQKYLDSNGEWRPGYPIAHPFSRRGPGGS
jgi:rSAM/selenodomain-associated transferase 2